MEGSNRRDGMTHQAGWLVRCKGCGLAQRNPMPDYCPRCGSPLEVQLDYDEALEPERLFDGCVTGVWKYVNLYPVSPDGFAVDLDLGEGGTALVRTPQAARLIGVEEVWCKCDHLKLWGWHGRASRAASE